MYTYAVGRPTFKFSVQPASWASATNSSRKRDTISSGSGTQLASPLTLQRIVSAYLMREALSMHPVVVRRDRLVSRVREERDGDANQVQSSAVKCNQVQSTYVKSVMVTPIEARCGAHET